MCFFESNDGFEIAAHDLRLRGPGELIGAKQSGVPLLRFADIERDSDLLRLASELADEMLNCSPKIANAHISRWLGYKSDYLKV